MCSELRSLAVELAPSTAEHPGRWISAGSPVRRVQWVEPRLVGEEGPTRSVRRMMADVPSRCGADQRDEGHLLPRSSRAAGLVSSRDTRHLLRARLSRGLIRAAPVAGHPSRCDGTAEPSARWLGPRETPSAAVRGRGVPAPDRRESGRGLLRTFPRRLSLASGGEGRGKAGCLASSWTTERKENRP